MEKQSPALLVHLLHGKRGENQNVSTCGGSSGSILRIAVGRLDSVGILILYKGL